MKFSELAKYLDGLSDFGIPACDMAVYKDHQCVFRHITGHSDYAKEKAATDQDLYNVYSNTKLMTVVAVMQLIEQSKLSLDDDVSKYIPAFSVLYCRSANGTVRTTEPITVYRLLTMTAGLSYGVYPSVEKVIKEKGEATVSTLDIVSAFALEPLEFEPGSGWRYSRCHDVLAAVVEVISGMKFSEYLQKNICGPLGMKHCYFNAQDDYVKEHLSALYSYDSANKKAIPRLNVEKEQYLHCPNYENGGAGLITSTDDYILLADSLANGGIGKTGHRVLKEESIEQIKTPQLNPLQQSQFINSHGKYGYGYGLGVRTLIDKSLGAGSPIGEFGWDGMTGGYGLVDMDNRLAICYMQNVHGCNYAWNEVFPKTRNMIYEIFNTAR